MDREPTWPVHRFGSVVERRKVTGYGALEPLSVFTDLGVVPRASQDWSYKALGESLDGYLLVEPRDIVFNKLRTWQGAIGVSEHRGIVSPAYFVCRPRTGVQPRFLHYLLRSTPWVQELKRVSKWMPPNQNDIAWDDLKAVDVLMPSSKRQQAIANFLDSETARINALIEKKQRVSTLAEERWAVETRAVLNALTPVMPIKHRWRIVDCKHRTPSYEAQGYPVVSPGDVNRGRLDLSVCHRFVGQTDFDDLTEGVRRPRRGDVIYSRNASAGIAAFIDTDEPFCMGQDVCLLTSRDQDQLFLAYALNSLGADQLEPMKVGSTITRVNVDQIGEIRVPVPNPEVQRRVSSGIDARRQQVDDLQNRLSRQAELLWEHRQALITAAVTGQLDVAKAAA